MSNLEEWWQEVINCAGEITYSIYKSRAYHELSQELDSTPRSYGIQMFERNYYLTVAVSRLYSFREKISHIIYHLFNQGLDVSFKKDGRPRILYGSIKEALPKFSEYVPWINSSDNKQIMDIFDKYATANTQKLFDYRHARIHRSDPGVGHLGKGLTFIKQKPEPKKVKYIIGHEEKIWNYEELLNLVLEVWKEFILVTKELAELKWFDYVIPY